MSNRSLRLPSSMSAAQRRATRPSQHPPLLGLVRLLGRGWHTRRMSKRHRSAKIQEAKREGLMPVLAALRWWR